MKKNNISKRKSQLRYPNRVNRVLLLIAAVFLLILSIIIVVSKSQRSHPASESDIPTASSATPIYLDTPPAQSEFYDTFKNNAQNWSVSNASGYDRMISHGGLTLTNTNQNSTLIESIPNNSSFANCTVIVDLTMLRVGPSDSVGIFFRGDTNLEHDYRIDLYGDGTFDIVKEYLDTTNNPQFVVLAKAKINNILKPLGSPNTILLAMDGPQMRVYINNLRVSAVTDSAYTAGQIALFAQANGESPEVQVFFSRVEIDKLGGTLKGG